MAKKNNSKRPNCYDKNDIRHPQWIIIILVSLYVVITLI